MMDINKNCKADNSDEAIHLWGLRAQIIFTICPPLNCIDQLMQYHLLCVFTLSFQQSTCS